MLYTIYIRIYTRCTLSNQICHLSATNPSLAPTRCGMHEDQEASAESNGTQVVDIHSQTWPHVSTYPMEIYQNRSKSANFFRDQKMATISCRCRPQFNQEAIQPFITFQQITTPWMQFHMPSFFQATALRHLMPHRGVTNSRYRCSNEDIAAKFEPYKSLALGQVVPLG